MPCNQKHELRFSTLQGAGKWILRSVLVRYAPVVLLCSSIVHATDQLSLVARYATSSGVDETRVGAFEGNRAARVSSVRATALLGKQELSVESLNSGKIFLHYEDFIEAMCCQYGELHVDVF
jgi:hypothetical protein